MKSRILLVLLLALVIAANAFAAKVVTAAAKEQVKQPQWWGPGAPNQTPMVKGFVTNVAAGQITLNLPQGVQTFAVTDRTEIMVEGRKATLADIRQGDPCAIKMQLVPQGYPIALVVRARPVDDGPPPVKLPGVGGVVTAVGSNLITLNTPKGAQSFMVTGETRVIVFGQKATIGDVRIGMRAEVAFRGADGQTPVALRINAVKPRIEGMVTAINANVLTVKAKEMTFAVTVAPNAKITFKDRPAALADIKQGFHVITMGELSGTNMLAEAVQIMPAARKGVVTAVNGSEITIATVEQMIITGILSDQTVITVRPRVGPNRPGTTADIKVESVVNVGGTMTEGGPYQGGTMQLMFVDIFVSQ